MVIDTSEKEVATTAFPSASHLSRYLDQVHELKRRDHVIDMICREPERMMFVPTVVDSCYLQFRKILELIAFSVLSANWPELRRLKEPHERDFNADKILRRIERKFGSVYPKPVMQMKQEDGPTDLQPRQEGFLTRADFTKLYGACGNVLHTRHPLRSEVDVDAYHREIPMWLTKIRNLLNSHIAKLVNDNNLHLVQMCGPTFEGRPTVTIFTPLPDG